VDFAQLSFSQKKVRLKSFIGFCTSVLVIKMSRSDLPIFCKKDTSRKTKEHGILLIVNYHPPLEVVASCFIDQTCYRGYIPQQ
jgi:hypothetical protein